MAFHYTEAKPWGRSFDEYQRMFALMDEDLTRRILGCGDGPAGFNASMAKRGRRMVSCDPLYQLTRDQIQIRIDATYRDIMDQTRKNQDLFVWTRIKSPEELGKVRMAAMQEFLTDYDGGKTEGRYVPGELPYLPFANRSFDISVCSHFLFLYSDNFSLEFHETAIREMCRVSKEVRIFPLLNYNGQPSPYVEPILRLFGGTVEPVPYEFQRGGNQMMKVQSGEGDGLPS